MKINRTVCFLGIVLIGIAGLAGADDVADNAMRVAIETQFDEQDIKNGGGPQVHVKDGVATLSGNVKSLWMKRQAVELALEIDGVERVDDELAIAFAENDDDVRKAIAKVVLRYPHFTIFDDVNIEVDNGTVRLTGRVTMPFKSNELDSRISRVAGVQSLANEIETLPININDQRIRADLVHRIYRDALFARYAFRVNPPIHIIVERGRVALTGAVTTEVEKRKAEIIARSTFGVFAVDNRLTVGT